ncbi:MAG: hypothetical protein HQL26_10770 [Candidatus Omnitrophica bacterium]|nr:hypothetical protein [Candidatus Omnitrophota bacterium]
MKLNELRELLQNKAVIEEINKHLWIESQKAGVSIGIERATDEWLRLYAMDWVKYHMPQKHSQMMKSSKKEAVKTVAAKKAVAVKKSAKPAAKKVVSKKK